MEQVASTIGEVPVSQQETSTQTHGAGLPARDSDYWPSLLMALALSSIAIGIVWDISWHETIGRDTFWTPAHMAIYFGGVLAGSVGGWLAIKHTFFAGPAERESSVSVFGARAPLGAWVTIWGALAMITSAPFDDWWHNAYGLDVKIISPPHAVLGLGMLGISAGTILLVLSRQNRLQDLALGSRKGSGLFIYVGGVFVLLGTVFILEYIFPNEQHGGAFYIVCALMYPTRLVALSCAGRVSWPATRIAAVYMGFICVVDWILMLFPAHPKLAPIFNPVTHMVPLPFPLLLIFPAAAIDLVLWKSGSLEGWFRRIGLAMLLGAVFFAALLGVQWFFSQFMLSPRAENWFFMGNRVWGYNAPAGDWHTHYWRLDPNRPDADFFTFRKAVVTFAIASFGAWLGLFFGRWMRKVRR